MCRPAPLHDLLLLMASAILGAGPFLATCPIFGDHPPWEIRTKKLIGPVWSTQRGRYLLWRRVLLLLISGVDGGAMKPSAPKLILDSLRERRAFAVSLRGIGD